MKYAVMVNPGELLSVPRCKEVAGSVPQDVAAVTSAVLCEGCGVHLLFPVSISYELLYGHVPSENPTKLSSFQTE